jgi:hypothetical protein
MGIGAMSVMMLSLPLTSVLAVMSLRVRTAQSRRRSTAR